MFTKNRTRLLEADIAKKSFHLVVEQARGLNLLSDEHGSLLEVCASLKSFKLVGQTTGDAPDDPGNPTVYFHGEERPTTRTSPRPIRMPCWHGRARVRKRN